MARVLLPKAVKVDSLLQAFCRAWPPHVSFTIILVAGETLNVFLFEFTSWDHVGLVLSHESWSFDNRVVVMARLKKGDTSSSINLFMIDFWVHLLDVPFK